MRLTERKTIYPKCDKQENLTEVKCIEIKNKGLAEEKLCQLEDIEDELGIDLITLFKILKRKRIYRVNEYDKKIQQMVMYGECDLTGILVYEKGFEYSECVQHLSYKDYGKTWALTKEELK